MTAAAYPVVITLPILWGDMDALGHVNNARYFTWFESARIEWVRRVGLSADGKGMGPILATAQCDYLRPVHFPGDVCVGVRATAVGNTSVTMEYAVWMAGAPETLFARATSVLVLVDYATSAKVRIPDEVRQRIAALSPAP